MADEVDKNSIAVALQYDQEKDHAPKVLAKGEGEVAKRILALAEAEGIYVHTDESVAELLALMELDAYIPVEAYVAVAEIISYLYRKNNEIKGRQQGED